jgi:hypothetical protein
MKKKVRAVALVLVLSLSLCLFAGCPLWGGEINFGDPYLRTFDTIEELETAVNNPEIWSADTTKPFLIPKLNVKLSIYPTNCPITYYVDDYDKLSTITVGYLFKDTFYVGFCISVRKEVNYETAQTFLINGVELIFDTTGRVRFVHEAFYSVLINPRGEQQTADISIYKEFMQMYFDQCGVNADTFNA